MEIDQINAAAYNLKWSKLQLRFWNSLVTDTTLKKKEIQLKSPASRLCHYLRKSPRHLTNYIFETLFPLGVL